MTKTRISFLLFLLMAAAITAFLFYLNVLIAPTIGGDTEWYIAAANGHLNTLIEPYSSRFLHTFLVGWLSQNTPLDTYQGFYLLAIASTFLFFTINSFILKDVIRTPFLLIPLLLLPYFFDTIREVFQPDSLYTFLTALFFLFVLFKKETYGLLTLFLMFMARESTILLGIIYAGMSWIWSKKTLVIAIVIIVAASLWLGGIMKNIGQPNIHNMNSSVYMAAKLSYNFATNVLGMKPWINTSNACEPIFRVALPHIKSLGTVQQIGLCGFDSSMPLKALITLLTIFGVAPLLLLFVLFKRFKNVAKGFSFGLILAAVYGIAHYLFGIVAGTGIQRIVGYGWPAFLLFVPFLIRAFFEIDKKFIIKLSLAQLVAAWLPLVVYKINGDGMNSLILILIAVVALYFYTFRIVKNQNIKPASDFETLPAYAASSESLPSC
ncbi:hypothetical protein D4R51_01400 [bacterium]|nr:MAG: hypothetical protein D4R51_01400 [bacterium]